MKVAIGSLIKKGPWGGGNLFIANLTQYLESKDVKVYFDLKRKDLDVLLLIDPRKDSLNSTFDHKDIKNYLDLVNKDAIVIHRINECDERKNTNYINKFYLEANKVANYTIFVSEWIKSIYESLSSEKIESSVVMTGANQEIFNSSNLIRWDKNSKLKIVTHHWGNNWNKGFDVYKKLDEMLITNEWKNLIEFTYIGNLPSNFSFKNANYIAPLSGQSLADELKKHNLYITASLNEPSGNHHIEGSQCGLPLMYINSGGIQEFAQSFGVEYELENLEKGLNTIIADYDMYFEKMKSYPFNSIKMSEDYLNIFKKALNENKNDNTLYGKKKIKKIFFMLSYKIKIFAKTNNSAFLIYKKLIHIYTILNEKYAK